MKMKIPSSRSLPAFFLQSCATWEKIVLAALWCGAAAAVFTGCRAVDPLHEAVYVSGISGWLPVCIALTGGGLAAVFYRHFTFSRMTWLPAAAAVLFACHTSFAGLLLALWSLAAALFYMFPEPWRDFRLSPRSAAVILAVLTMAAWGSGVYMQSSAYRSLFLAYMDWGIYLDGYLKIASGQAPLAGWLSIGDHWNPCVNVLMALLVGHGPNPWSMFAVHSALLVSAGPLLYILARSLRMVPAAALLCALGGLLNPVLSNQHLALFYGYHPIEWLIPAALGFMVARERHCRWGMVLCAVFACGIQETVFVFIFGYGIVQMLERKYRMGAALMLGAVCCFGLIAWGIMPHLGPARGYFQAYQYSHLGNSAGTILLSPLLRPEVFWRSLFRLSNGLFLLLLLLPTAPAAWAAPRLLLAAVPVTLAVLLKLSYADTPSVVQWYGVDATVWLLLAMAYGMSFLLARKKFTSGMAAALCFTIISGGLFFGKTLFAGYYSFRPLAARADRTAAVQRLKQIIPEGAEVALPPRLQAHFFQRNRTRAWNAVSPVPEWRILDFGDSLIPGRELLELRDRLAERQAERPAASFNHFNRQFCVYHKGEGEWHLPFLIPEKTVAGLPAFPLKNEVSGLESRVLPQPENRRLVLFLRWRSPAAEDGSFSFLLRSQGKQFFYHCRWAEGVLSPRMTPPDVWFQVILPYPANWTRVEDLRIRFIP